MLCESCDVLSPLRGSSSGCLTCQTRGPEIRESDLFYWTVSLYFSEAFIHDGHFEKNHKSISENMFENKISKVETGEISVYLGIS